MEKEMHAHTHNIRSITAACGGERMEETHDRHE